MLSATLAADPTLVAVRFVFTVKNTGDTRVTLNFTSGLKADFFVTHEGEEVWRWSSDRAFTQALETDTIPPAEHTTYTAEWPAPDPGQYTAVAELLADTDAQANTEFTVTNATANRSRNT